MTLFSMFFTQRQSKAIRASGRDHIFNRKKEGHWTCFACLFAINPVTGRVESYGMRAPYDRVDNRGLDEPLPANLSW